MIFYTQFILFLCTFCLFIFFYSQSFNLILLSLKNIFNCVVSPFPFFLLTSSRSRCQLTVSFVNSFLKAHIASYHLSFSLQSHSTCAFFLITCTSRISFLPVYLCEACKISTSLLTVYDVYGGEQIEKS